MMNGQIELLLRHGYLVLFLALLIEGIGLPIPAVPWLLAAGALASYGKLGLLPLLALGILAETSGDLLWFELGRRHGAKILRLLCRLSLEQDSSVGGTKEVYHHHGASGLLFSKFIPGFGAVMPPLIGIFGVSVSKFLLLDTLGSILYVGSYIGLGYAFSNQLEPAFAAAQRLGPFVIVAIASVVLAYAAYKWCTRRLFLRRLRMARITPEELRRMQVEGLPVMIFDLRFSAELKTTPRLVSGARWIAREEFERRHGEIPRDREVVIYCNCPNEASAATFAMILKKHGITRVRPLRGGLDGWIEKMYPTDSITPTFSLRTL
jgi:membrane protein DedA with SNARE-associated domain/rhodanese-related sulfurtransferase